MIGYMPICISQRREKAFKLQKELGVSLFHISGVELIIVEQMAQLYSSTPHKANYYSVCLSVTWATMVG